MWPEHFDAAVAPAGDDRGATYGLALGDRFDPLPYVYATRWSGGDDDPFYNAPFGGAWLPYAEVAGAPDPRAAGLAFLREARQKRLGYGPWRPSASRSRRSTRTPSPRWWPTAARSASPASTAAGACST